MFSPKQTINTFFHSTFILISYRYSLYLFPKYSSIHIVLFSIDGYLFINSFLTRVSLIYFELQRLNLTCIEYELSLLTTIVDTFSILQLSHLFVEKQDEDNNIIVVVINIIIYFTYFIITYFANIQIIY